MCAGNNYEDCKVRFLSKPTTPSRLNFNVTSLADSVFTNQGNSLDTARQILSTHSEIIGFISKTSNERILALNINGRLTIFPNKTEQTNMFWKSFENTTEGWTPAFKDCHFLKGNWFYNFVAKRGNVSTGFFVKLKLDQCEENLTEIFGKKHQCDEETTYVSSLNLGKITAKSFLCESS